jgi:hypothetical protein
MKLAKKARIRAKQIDRAKRIYQTMSEAVKDLAFAKVHATVQKRWKKRGYNF